MMISIGIEPPAEHLEPVRKPTDPRQYRMSRIPGFLVPVVSRLPAVMGLWSGHGGRLTHVLRVAERARRIIVQM